MNNSQFQEIKRTLLAGSIIAVLLMGASFFGVFDTPGSEEVVVAPSKTIENNQSEQKPVQDSLDVSSTNNTNEEPVIKETNYEVVNRTINNGVMQAELSSFGGGSFITYQLIDKNNKQYKFLGNFNYNDGQPTYNSSQPVQLILKESADACAPCVYIKNVANGSVEIIQQPFASSNNFTAHNNDIINKDASFEFVYTVENKYQIVKVVDIKKESYISNHSASIENLDGVDRTVGLIWNKGLGYTEDTFLSTELSTDVAAYMGVDNSYESYKHGDSARKDQNVDWLSIRNKYFTLAFIGETPYNTDVNASDLPFSYKDVTTVPVYEAKIDNNSSSISTQLFLGPLDYDLIGELSYLDKIMNFGVFIINPFSRGVLWILKALGPDGLGIHYALVLILFAFGVRLITGPLTKKSHKSTLAMQQIQPEMKKIQEKYKGEPQKLNQEMIKLYKERGVNPLGGCLPILIQMPLLIALFQVFRYTIEFRGVNFFWIENLALPDVIIGVPDFVANIWGVGWFYGHGIALLPIVVGITMILSQRLNSKAMEAKQKPMMYMMSAFFFLLFNTFPSGLNLYYAVYNILNYIQQKSIKSTA